MSDIEKLIAFIEHRQRMMFARPLATETDEDRVYINELQIALDIIELVRQEDMK